MHVPAGSRQPVLGGRLRSYRERTRQRPETIAADLGVAVDLYLAWEQGTAAPAHVVALGLDAMLQAADAEILASAAPVGADSGEGVFAFFYHARTGRVRRVGSLAGELGLPTIGPAEGFVGYVHPDDRERLLCNRLGEAGALSVVYRLRAQDGDWRWLRDVAVRVRVDDAGRPISFFGVTLDIGAQRLDELRLRESEQRLANYQRRLEAALAAAGMGTFEVDLQSGRAIIDEREAALLDLPPETKEIPQAEILERLHPDDRARDERMRALHVQGERPYDLVFRLKRPGGGYRWLRGVGDFVDPSSGRTRVAGFNLDVSEQEEARERELLLRRELDHRCRNILATVRALATVGGRTATSLDEYRQTLLERLEAFSRAHDLLVRSRWEGARLADVLRDECRAFLPDTADALRLEGPDVELEPTAARGFALSVHELLTNAVKHGALSNDGGTVTCRWGHDADGCLVFEWREAGGPEVVAPKAGVGLGRDIILGAMAAYGGGETDLRFEPTGLVCTLRIATGERRGSAQPRP